MFPQGVGEFYYLPIIFIQVAKRVCREISSRYVVITLKYELILNDVDDDGG